MGLSEIVNRGDGCIVLDESQASLWAQYRERAGAGSDCAYFSNGYYQLYRSNSSFSEAFVFLHGKNVFFLPYLKNRISNTSYYDIGMVSGFGGPLSNCSENSFLKKAWGGFYNYCKESGIIVAFLRFNPVLENHTLADPSVATVIADRNVVKLSLDKTYESIWSGYSESNKNKIRKAKKNHIEIRKGNSLESLLVFREMYLKTMNRVRADQSYFFDKEYFERIFSFLKDRYRVFLACKDNKVIGGCLFFFTNYMLDYHLSATEEGYRNLGVANLLRDETIRFALERKIKVINFGGGRTANEDDQLFKFKLGFSKETARFYFGKMVINKDVYDELCSRWKDESRISKVKEHGQRVLMYRY